MLKFLLGLPNSPKVKPQTLTTTFNILMICSFPVLSPLTLFPTTLPTHPVLATVASLISF